MREFGARVMDAKQLLKTIPAQLEHKDKNVREAAKGLAVEMYRWLGPALKTSLEGSLKPVQVQMYMCGGSDMLLQLLYDCTRHSTYNACTYVFGS